MLAESPAGSNDLAAAEPRVTTLLSVTAATVEVGPSGDLLRRIAASSVSDRVARATDDADLDDAHVLVITFTARALAAWDASAAVSQGLAITLWIGLDHGGSTGSGITS